MGEEEPAAEPESHEIPRMADDQLKEFVLGLCDGQIFTSEHVPEKQNFLLGNIFLPLGLGAFVDWKDEEIAKLGIAWEWIREAGPRGVNGFPNFFSVRLMHIDDWKRAHKAYETEMKRRKTIKV